MDRAELEQMMLQVIDAARAVNALQRRLAPYYSQLAALDGAILRTHHYQPGFSLRYNRDGSALRAPLFAQRDKLNQDYAPTKAELRQAKARHDGLQKLLKQMQKPTAAARR